MNVYVDDIGYRSYSIKRIVSAFKDYSPPTINVVDNQEEADLILVHVYGRLNKTKQRIELLKRQGKQYAIMQYTLRHCLSPNTTDWLDLWGGSAGVWSYLNLKDMTEKDGNSFNFNFYYAPLGVDTETFYPMLNDHYYQVMTVGVNYMTEGIREAVLASNDINRRSLHIGMEIKHPNVDSFVDIDDKTFTKLLNRCTYVTGLRRGEGFEMHCAEALVCGVRPIVFDAPHYHAWYDDLALFVQADSREILINDLKNIFTGEERPVTSNEIEEAKHRFDWNKLITGFWNNLWIH